MKLLPCPQAPFCGLILTRQILNIACRDEQTAVDLSPWSRVRPGYGSRLMFGRNWRDLDIGLGKPGSYIDAGTQQVVLTHEIGVLFSSRWNLLPGKEFVRSRSHSVDGEH